MLPLQNHPNVQFAYIERRGYSCSRCIEAGKCNEDWIWFGIRRAVPLINGEIVCWRHATEEERRNRWCGRCERALDKDEFDRPMICRSCSTRAAHQRSCEHCGIEFVPARKDARFCSGRCRVAAHRARR